MLLNLYKFFGNLLIETATLITTFDRRNLTSQKWLILICLIGIILYVVSYSFSSLSKYLCYCVDNFIEGKISSLSQVSGFIFRSINELKFALSLLIIALGTFSLVFKHYINRHNAEFFDLLVVRVNIDPDFPDNILDADLNRADRQNVHNGSVSKHLIDSVQRLIEKEKENSVQTQSKTEIYNEIRQCLIGHQHNDSHQALDVLDQINNLNGFHTGTQSHEMEILRLVWQRINHSINHSNLENLQENLLVQLADCKNGGIILCITGRITRIVQSLECLDAENIVDIKPLWAIKDRIGEYCGRYSDKLLEKAPQNYQDAIEIETSERTPKQQKLVDEYNQCLIDNLNRKFQIMYVKTGILNCHQLKDLTETFYETIKTS